MLPPKQSYELSHNSVIKATAPCVCKIWLPPLYWVMSHIVDHCIITTRVQFSLLHYCIHCNTALMLPPKQHCELSNNSVIKAIAPCVCKIWLPSLLWVIVDHRITIQDVNLCTSVWSLTKTFKNLQRLLAHLLREIMNLQDYVYLRRYGLGNLDLRYFNTCVWWCSGIFCVWRTADRRTADGGLDVVCQEIQKVPYLRTADRFTIRIRRKNTASRISWQNGSKRWEFVRCVCWCAAPDVRVISLTFPVVKLFQLHKLLAFHNFLLVKKGQFFKSPFKQIYCYYLKIHVKSFLMTYHMA
jgi:hypothetical protein